MGRQIKATGGAIVPEKNHWYLINFEWTGRKWKYRLIEEIRGILDVKTFNNSHRILLERCEYNDAKKTLEVSLAINRNTKETNRIHDSKSSRVLRSHQNRKTDKRQSMVRGRSDDNENTGVPNWVN